VMGHELNNSLAPIKSIAGSLTARIAGSELGTEEREDFKRGLSIIESRAASLNRFLQAYRQLAQMPLPVIRECSIAQLVNRVAALEQRVQVQVIPGPDMVIFADPDQIEQMLINLVRNAAEAVIEVQGTGPRSNGSGRDAAVALSWEAREKELLLTVVDRGAGLMNPSNAFVPFYTTKPQGSGIGLIVSRQICESHGGSLELVNSTEHAGCIAKVVLPRVARY
jgi:nitrogen fixation/metabolism regulation signal transduction histidine kinase